MELSRSGYVRNTAREFAVLAVAALGAYIFFIHGSLYVQPGSVGRPLTLEGFLLVTAILYLFLRLVFVVAGLYYPRPIPQPAVCTECGKALDEPTAPPVVRRASAGRVRRPTEKEVLAAVMLRKAIDDARRLAKKDLVAPPAVQARLPGEPENAPVSFEEVERILKELDTPRNPRPSDERRPKGDA